jgi:hypothetical protein
MHDVVVAFLIDVGPGVDQQAKGAILAGVPCNLLQQVADQFFNALPECFDRGVLPGDQVAGRLPAAGIRTSAIAVLVGFLAAVNQLREVAVELLAVPAAAGSGRCRMESHLVPDRAD